MYCTCISLLCPIDSLLAILIINILMGILYMLNLMKFTLLYDKCLHDFWCQFRFWPRIFIKVYQVSYLERNPDLFLNLKMMR